MPSLKRSVHATHAGGVHVFPARGDPLVKQAEYPRLIFLADISIQFQSEQLFAMAYF